LDGKDEVGDTGKEGGEDPYHEAAALARTMDVWKRHIPEPGSNPEGQKCSKL
jgi:hypothetical protein